MVPDSKKHHLIGFYTGDTRVGTACVSILLNYYGIADAFYWPVLWRFRTYNLLLDTASPEAVKWMKTMWSDPRVKEEGHRYFREAERRETCFSAHENLFKDNPDIEYGQFTEDWEFAP
ncbi:hypothetical protein VTO42DRAFT_5364 [Malbranchea cinnamomea]